LNEIKNNTPPFLATLALIDSELDRMPLIMAGVDECLSENNYDEFLFPAIERAIVGHTLRQNKGAMQVSGRALVCSIDNTRVNLISYQMEEHGYTLRVVSDIDEARHCLKDPFDLVMVDYDFDNSEEFREIRDLFCELPVIALCDEIVHGQQAIVDGASNYLCMPPCKEDIQMVLELAATHLGLKS